MPLFDRPREAIPPEQKPPAAEPWREVAVDVLRNHGLSQAIVEHLDENDFKTIGHLADWTTQDNALTAIAGIGKAKAEKIEQALESFWASQQTAPEQPAAEATGDELEEDWLTDETEESTDE